jgi:hypothetical protein
MRQDTLTAEKTSKQLGWLKLFHALLHLGVLLGGAFGLPQAVAASNAALQDAQTRGELTLARESGRAAAVGSAKRSGGPDPASSKPNAFATAQTTALLPVAQGARSIDHVSLLHSHHASRAFQARAPPRTS